MVFSVYEVRAEWVDLSKGLDELDIRSIASDRGNSAVIYVASGKSVYRTVNAGNSWQKVLRLHAGDTHIDFIYIDPSDSKIIYVCTDHGVYKSESGGEGQWSLIFEGVSETTKKVICVSMEPIKPEILWIGTEHGLFYLNQKSHVLEKESKIPNAVIYSILLDGSGVTNKIVSTDQGIYKNLTDHSWQKVFVPQTAQDNEDADTQSLQQFGVEEIATVPLFSNLAYSSGQGRFYAATRSGILQSDQNAVSWTNFEGQQLPDRKVNSIASSQKAVYVATNRGVFRWDSITHSFSEMYAGLVSREVRILEYNDKGKYLLAATKRGIYRFSDPESADIELSNMQVRPISMQLTNEMLARFSNEPTVLEVQQAAIRYAEVSPEKIAQWRIAAARKAWAPSLSFHQDFENRNNVDIDRGGTADPDKFIQGPQEKSWDRYFTVSWNLADLIWNSDQTSIDSRSKLMVELRNDVLNEVTHLYFERRRLQLEMLTDPTEQSSVNLDRQLRLQEFTANIDALTGGFLTNSLKKGKEL